MSNELLPCPFCGGEVGFHKDEDCNGCHYIWCHSCDGMFDLSAKADPENDTETLEELNERIAPIWNNRAQQSAPAGYVMVPDWWKIERSFDVLPHPCVDGKSHQPTIKIVLPACAPDDMAAFDVRDQIAETVRKLLAAAPKAVCPKCFDLTGCPSCAPAVEVEGLHPLIETLRENGGLIACRVDVAQQKVIIDQQAARIAELQLDADRYRWLEANSTYGIDYRQRPELTLPIYAPDHREGLDAAIDAAMGEKHGN